MSWYTESANTWHRRHAITVRDLTGGSPGSFDIEFTMGQQHAEFWANIQSNAYDLILTQADGVTTINHKRAAFNYAGQTATIQLDNASLDRAAGDARLHLLWVYFDAETTVSVDPASVFTASSPLAAAVWPGKIRDALVIPPQMVGDDKPRMIQQKTSTDEAQINIDLRHFLDLADTEINGSNAYDEVAWIEFSGETATVETSLWNGLALAYDLTGRYLRAVFTGGTTATDYVQWCRVAVANPDEKVNGTTEPKKVYDQRLIVQVRNVVET
jgi:hypothetical protein